jgi:histidinol-phosphate/aromatic aminotransferase/cobyric acid decarboxylase-like protein
MNPNVKLARPEILTLQPYVYAAWDYRYERMHANENPWRAAGDTSDLGLNLYPESPATALHMRLAELYGVQVNQVLAGRGSDEGIDLLIRSFCRAGQDSIVTCPPTFGFYRVAAEVQGANVIEVPLIRSDAGFALDTEKLLTTCNNTENIKLVFLCSPGNPPGNALDPEAMLTICRALNGRALVIVDEAYIEFTGRPSFTTLLADYPNLVVLRTLSKAYSLAGARCGTTIANKEIIDVLARVIPPYAIPTSTVESVLKATSSEQRARIAEQIQILISERNQLRTSLKQCALIKHVFPSDANFLLVECADADAVFNAARSVGLIIRDQRKQPQCNQCLRITVGTPEQNAKLLKGIQAATKTQVTA